MHSNQEDDLCLNSTISRRALVAGIASIPTASAALATVPPGTPDLVCALIEAHRAAFISQMEASEITIALEDDTPEHQAAVDIETIAWEEMRAAEHELACIVPTTMAGVLALLAYVDDFHTQAITLSKDPNNWHSMGEILDDLIDDNIVDRFNGKPIELPFTFWILRNVRLALEAMAVTP